MLVCWSGQVDCAECLKQHIGLTWRDGFQVYWLSKTSSSSSGPPLYPLRFTKRRTPVYHTVWFIEKLYMMWIFRLSMGFCGGSYDSCRLYDHVCHRWSFENILRESIPTSHLSTTFVTFWMFWGSLECVKPELATSLGVDKQRPFCESRKSTPYLSTCTQTYSVHKYFRFWFLNVGQWRRWSLKFNLQLLVNKQGG